MADATQVYVHINVNEEFDDNWVKPKNINYVTSWSES